MCLIEILRGELWKLKWSWHRRRVKAILKTRRVFLLLLRQGRRRCLLWLESTQALGVTWSAISLEVLGCHEVRVILSPSLFTCSSNNDLLFFFKHFLLVRWRFEKAWGKRSYHTLCDWSEVSFSYSLYSSFLMIFFSCFVSSYGW